MHFINPKFKGQGKYYFFQCLLAMLFVLLSLAIAHRRFTDLTMASSIGASTFIAFTMPHSSSSAPRYLIGGYLTGITSGLILRYINSLDLLSSAFLGFQPYMLWCALAVGAALFLMAAFNLQHPPAAALAMGLVIDQDCLHTAAAAFFSIIILSALKSFLKKWMIDLI